MAEYLQQLIKFFVDNNPFKRPEIPENTDEEQKPLSEFEKEGSKYVQILFNYLPLLLILFIKYKRYQKQKKERQEAEQMRNFDTDSKKDK